MEINIIGKSACRQTVGADARTGRAASGRVRGSCHGAKITASVRTHDYPASRRPPSAGFRRVARFPKWRDQTAGAGKTNTLTLKLIFDA